MRGRQCGPSEGAGARGARQLVGRSGAAEQVALVGVAAALGEQGALGFGLHAFGDHLQAHGVRQRDDGAGDGGVVGVHQHVAHEGVVDLQFGQRQALEIGERGVAGAEVVEREAHAQAAQFGHARDDLVDVLEQHAFGEFDAQPRRVGAGVA